MFILNKKRMGITNNFFYKPKDPISKYTSPSNGSVVVTPTGPVSTKTPEKYKGSPVIRGGGGGGGGYSSPSTPSVSSPQLDEKKEKKFSPSNIRLIGSSRGVTSIRVGTAEYTGSAYIPELGMTAEQYIDKKLEPQRLAQQKNGRGDVTYTLDYMDEPQVQKGLDVEEAPKRIPEDFEPSGATIYAEPTFMEKLKSGFGFLQFADTTRETSAREDFDNVDKRGFLLKKITEPISKLFGEKPSDRSKEVVFPERRQYGGTMSYTPSLNGGSYAAALVAPAITRENVALGKSIENEFKPAQQIAVETFQEIQSEVLDEYEERLNETNNQEELEELQSEVREEIEGRYKEEFNKEGGKIQKAYENEKYIKETFKQEYKGAEKLADTLNFATSLIPTVMAAEGAISLQEGTSKIQRGEEGGFKETALGAAMLIGGAYTGVSGVRGAVKTAQKEALSNPENFITQIGTKTTKGNKVFTSSESITKFEFGEATSKLKTTTKIDSTTKTFETIAERELKYELFDDLITGRGKTGVSTTVTRVGGNLENIGERGTITLGKSTTKAVSENGIQLTSQKVIGKSNDAVGSIGFSDKGITIGGGGRLSSEPKILADIKIKSNFGDSVPSVELIGGQSGNIPITQTTFLREVKTEPLSNVFLSKSKKDLSGSITNINIPKNRNPFKNINQPKERPINILENQKVYKNVGQYKSINPVSLVSQGERDALKFTFKNSKMGLTPSRVTSGILSRTFNKRGIQSSGLSFQDSFYKSDFKLKGITAPAFKTKTKTIQKIVTRPLIPSSPVIDGGRGINDGFSPTPPPPISFFKYSPDLNIEKRKNPLSFSKKPQLKVARKYTPTLLGLYSGRTITREQAREQQKKGVIGSEIRFPIVDEKQKTYNRRKFNLI